MFGWTAFLFPSKIELRASYTPPMRASLRSDLCKILMTHVSGQDPDPGASWGPRLEVFACYSMLLTCDSGEVGPKSNMKPFHAKQALLRVNRIRYPHMQYENI